MLGMHRLLNELIFVLSFSVFGLNEAQGNITTIKLMKIQVGTVIRPM